MPKNQQLNVCSWHEADKLTELKVRFDRTTDTKAVLRINCIFVSKLQSLKAIGRDELFVIMTYKYSQFEDGQERFKGGIYIFLKDLIIFFVIYCGYTNLVISGVGDENE